MSQSTPVTETAIVYLKPGTDFEDVYAGNENNGLVQLGKKIAAQEGFVRQYWGHQIENPEIFVWSIDWKSLDHHKTFVNHEDYKNFIASASEVFDFERAAPLLMHTTFTSDANAARDAPVTENAFFMLPKDADEAAKTKLEDDLMSLLQATSSVGKSSAFALGWVFEDLSNPHATTGDARAVQAIVGWDTIEAHHVFTKAPEFLQTVTPVKDQCLPPLLDGTGTFHVDFRPVV